MGHEIEPLRLLGEGLLGVMLALVGLGVGFLMGMGADDGAWAMLASGEMLLCLTCLHLLD